MVFDPKPGRFPDERPAGEDENEITLGGAKLLPPPPPAGEEFGGEMGLAAGGKMKQELYPDPHGVEVWDQDQHGRVFVHVVNSMMYRQITGEEPPPTPITARLYTEYGFPWFELYDENKGDLPPTDKLKAVKTVKQMDHDKGFAPQQDDSPVNVPDDQVKTLGKSKTKVKDGKW